MLGHTTSAWLVAYMVAVISWLPALQVMCSYCLRQYPQFAAVFVGTAAVADVDGTQRTVNDVGALSLACMKKPSVAVAHDAPEVMRLEQGGQPSCVVFTIPIDA